MSRTHLRAFLVAFVAVLAVVGGTLVATANNGDADATALAAAESPTTTTAAPAATSPTPPVDGEQVLAEAQQRMQAFADAVTANEAAQAAEAAQAEQGQQLEALAQAQAQAESAASSGIPDGYWDRMAQCETDGNWSMVGSRYSGGLGFYNGTWDAFGGREFAARAGQATRAQQIIVANRVAHAVGLTGWGCLRTVGRP
jgi:hypothetical protein